MNDFFRKLRDIQKKERTDGPLSEIDDSFYDDASNYLQSLLKVVDDNPLSLEAYQLRDAQRITIEICERREAKIISSAISNVQKAHDIFKGHNKNSELYEVIPYNVTPEEEKLYKDVVNTIISHRENLMEEIIPHRNSETKIGFKPNEVSKEIKEEFTKVDRPIHHEHIMEVEKQPPAPKLDESQIAMMYGKAPDELLFDENNNPITEVNQKNTDIPTPFTPPKPPVEDTVVLQNNQSKPNIDDKSNQTEEDLVVPDEILNDEVDDAVIYNSEELVEFKEDICTDILDENEKTYGPFENKDMVLLPKSIVKILNHRNVINIIK